MVLHVKIWESIAIKGRYARSQIDLRWALAARDCDGAILILCSTIRTRGHLLATFILSSEQFAGQRLPETLHANVRGFKQCFETSYSQLRMNPKHRCTAPLSAVVSNYQFARSESSDRDTEIVESQWGP